MPGLPGTEIRNVTVPVGNLQRQALVKGHEDPKQVGWKMTLWDKLCPSKKYARSLKVALL